MTKVQNFLQEQLMTLGAPRAAGRVSGPGGAFLAQPQCPLHAQGGTWVATAGSRVLLSVALVGLREFTRGVRDEERSELNVFST